MSDGFTIGAAQGTPTIFECPKCRETIDSSTDFCRFCGAKVDKEAAERAALLLSKINQACSDASYLRTTALAIPVFFVLQFVPILGWVGRFGFIALCFVAPVWALRWWFKYRAIESKDTDYNKALTTVIAVGVIVAIVLVIFVILPYLLMFFVAMRR